jgi:hypothetical protein
MNINITINAKKVVINNNDNKVSKKTKNKKNKNKIQSSYLMGVYPSLATGKPVAVILTGLDGSGENGKLGRIISSHIISVATDPINATKTGDNTDNCGYCPLKNGICYVNYVYLQNLYRKFIGDGYQPLTREILTYVKNSNIGLRLGSYGDPAIIDIQNWLPLLAACQNGGIVGYSHQWQEKWFDHRWSKYLMASCETVEQVTIANKMGLRTYRVGLKEELPMPNESLCPYTATNGIKCSSCMRCGGKSFQGKLEGRTRNNVFVRVHGIPCKVNRYKKYRLGN